MPSKGGTPRGRPRRPSEADPVSQPWPVPDISRRRHSRSQISNSTGGGQTFSPAKRRRRWGGHCRPRALSLAIVLWALCQCLPRTVGQPVGNSLSPTSVVSTSSFFASSLGAPPPYNTMLIIEGFVQLDAADFPQPIEIVNHTVTIFSDEATPGTLDFGGLTDVILVGNTSGLVFRNMILQGIPDAVNASTSGNNVVSDLALWPSVSAEPGATFNFTDTVTYYRVPANSESCASYSLNLVAQLEQNGETGIQMPNPDSVLVPGTYNLSLIVKDSGINVGTVASFTSNVTSVCTTGSSGLSGGDIAGIAVGAAAAVVATLALMCLLCRSCRRRAAPPADVEMLEPKSSAEKPPPEIASSSISPSDSQPGTARTLSGMLRALTLNFSRRSSEPSSNTTATDSAKASDAKQMNEYHQTLMKLRLEGGLDGIELGPVLGQGSFGRVYKGKWQGALVAIKVVEHRLRKSLEEMDEARESLLSASVSHPNVIACYKICTVKVNRAVRDRTKQVVDDVARIQENRAKLINVGGQSIVEGPREGDSSSGPSSRRDPPGSGSGSGGAAIEIEVLPAQSEVSSGSSQEATETWMLLEFADRGSLDKAIETRRFYRRGLAALDLANVYRTLLDIALGIRYLHDLGIVHGDLKPANVLLKSTVTDARGFTAKLADFGLSRLMDNDQSHISTQTFGTIPYMPPELLADGRMTRAVDVYSFGIIMWQIYTGLSPYSGWALAQVMYAVVHADQRPSVPEDMPHDYCALMKACWTGSIGLRPVIHDVVSELARQARRVTDEASVAKVTDAAPVPSPFVSVLHKLSVERGRSQEVLPSGLAPGSGGAPSILSSSAASAAENAPPVSMPAGVSGAAPVGAMSPMSTPPRPQTPPMIRPARNGAPPGEGYFGPSFRAVPEDLMASPMIQSIPEVPGPSYSFGSGGNGGSGGRGGPGRLPPRLEPPVGGRMGMPGTGRPPVAPAFAAAAGRGWGLPAASAFAAAAGDSIEDDPPGLGEETDLEAGESDETFIPVKLKLTGESAAAATSTNT